MIIPVMALVVYFSVDDPSSTFTAFLIIGAILMFYICIPGGFIGVALACVGLNDITEEYCDFKCIDNLEKHCFANKIAKCFRVLCCDYHCQLVCLVYSSPCVALAFVITAFIFYGASLDDADEDGTGGFFPSRAFS